LPSSILIRNRPPPLSHRRMPPSSSCVRLRQEARPLGYAHGVLVSRYGAHPWRRDVDAAASNFPTWRWWAFGGKAGGRRSIVSSRLPQSVLALNRPPERTCSLEWVRVRSQDCERAPAR
jgi:hypothetical protein